VFTALDVTTWRQNKGSVSSLKQNGQNKNTTPRFLVGVFVQVIMIVGGMGGYKQ